MKLDGHQLGLAGAATSAIIFTACSIFMHLWPTQAIDMKAALAHLSSFGPLTEYFALNAQVFVSGLVQVAVYSYLYIRVFIHLYHHMNKKH